MRELVVLSGIGDGVSARKAWAVEEVYDEFLLERANAGDKALASNLLLSVPEFFSLATWNFQPVTAGNAA